MYVMLPDIKRIGYTCLIQFESDKIMKMNADNQIEVTVWCLTYNHRLYIRDALEGFVNQITNFKYKVVIYDDASTDGTSDIVAEYKKKYPDLFDITIADNNRYSQGKLGSYLIEWRREKIEGNYTAICEGDDCWVDRFKLQRQYDYMKSHTECALCMHNAIWMDYEQSVIRSDITFTGNINGRLKSAKEIIIQKNAHPPTASFLLKNEIWDMPDFFFNGFVTDYPIQLAALCIGTIYCDSRYMSIYRCGTPKSHGSRIKANKNFSECVCLNLINFLYRYNKYTKFQYKDYVEGAITRFTFSLIECMKEPDEIEKIVEENFKRGLISEKLEINIIDKLQELSDFVYVDNFIPERVLNYIEENNQIWIMGAGKYSRMLGKKFLDNDIPFEGYVVSDLDNNPDNIDGKKVSMISEDIIGGIIVGILPVERENIINSLENKKLLNYIFAYS